MHTNSFILPALVALLASVIYFLSPDLSIPAERARIEHQSLPPVYDFEDTRGCLSGLSPSKVYCVSRTFIDTNTSLHRVIESSKEKYFHFNREIISHGICIEKCEKLLAALSPAARQDLLSESSERKILHFGDEKLRLRYDAVVQQCVNLNLLDYGGRGHAEIEFCVAESGDSYDVLDWIFFLVLGSIAAAAISSTFYEYFEGEKKVLKSFSFIGNWKSYTSAPNENDFVFLDCLKVLMNAIIVGGHVYYLLVSNPHRNSIFFEVNHYSVFMRFAVVLNCANDVCFIISGFLLSLGDVKKLQNGKVFTPKDMLIGFRNRYFRLAPLLAFTILLQSTWAAKIFSGPVWTYMAEREKAFCRKNYWANLLFINNFVNLDTGCILQTWYISNDLQLYALKYLFLIIVSHYQKHKLTIFQFSMAVFVLISSVVAYIVGIKGVFLLSVEALRSFTRTDPYFNYFIKPTYCNLCCYFMGVATAFAYHEIKTKNIDLKQSTAFTLSWNSIKFLLVLLVSATFILGPLPFEQPLLFAPIAGLVKLSWGFVISLIILGYRNGFGGFWRDLANAHAWRRLSKVNYSIVMCHIFTYQLLMGGAMSMGPVEISNGLLGAMMVFLVGASYIMAVIFYMLVELPAANLLNCWIRKEVDENSSSSKSETECQ